LIDKNQSQNPKKKKLFQKRPLTGKKQLKNKQGGTAPLKTLKYGELIMPVANLKSKWTSGNLVFTGTGAMHFGVDDDGIDVKFFGATASAYMLWDESADELVFGAGASIDLTAEKVMIDLKAGDASSIDPSATAETGWININVDGTKVYVPYYAAS
jgi:hypothetical protein